MSTGRTSCSWIRLYDKCPDITCTRVGIVIGSIFIGIVTMPKEVLLVLSKPWMNIEVVARQFESTCILSNRSRLQTLSVKIVSMRFCLMPTPLT